MSHLLHRRHVLSAGIAMMLLATSLGAGVSMAESTSSPDFSEATAFFAQLARNSKNPLITGMARESLDRLQNHHSGATRQVVVPLLEQPDASLVIPTLVNEHVMGTFIVDTGATYTVITPGLAKKLGVRITADTPRIPIVTANGSVSAPLVTLNNVSIGELKVPSVQAVVQTLGDGEDLLLSGLLGMNFFHGMDLTVKQDRLIIGVRPISKASR